MKVQFDREKYPDLRSTLIAMLEAYDNRQPVDREIVESLACDACNIERNCTEVETLAAA